MSAGTALPRAEQRAETERLMAPYTIASCSVPGLVPLPPPAAALRLPEDIVEAYLARLCLQRPAAPTKEALAALLAAHVDRVAYESIDIHAGGTRPPPSLTAIECANRVAVQQRGGYCFIVVSAFSALLQALGFSVSLHTAFCGDEDDPRFLSGDAWGDHVVLVAHLACGHYIADVVSAWLASTAMYRYPSRAEWTGAHTHFHATILLTGRSTDASIRMLYCTGAWDGTERAGPARRALMV